MTIKQASEALRKGLSMRASLPVVGHAEHVVNGLTYRAMTIGQPVQPKGNRRQRRAKAARKP